jgi:hypothetical protein
MASTPLHPGGLAHYPATATSHRANSLSASGPPPSSSSQYKRTSTWPERTPAERKTLRHPVGAVGEHRRADVEPLPPKLPPKDPHRIRAIHSPPPSHPSPQQPTMASHRQDRSSKTHKQNYSTGSFQPPGVPASPPSSRHHSSSRRGSSSQPLLPSGVAYAKHPIDASVLPAPGILASRRAASPPRRNLDMQRMAIPLAHSSTRPTKF